MLHDDERVSFDVYFASLMSMQMHPGAGTKEHRQLTPEECRDLALRMVDIRRGVIADKGN